MENLLTSAWCIQLKNFQEILSLWCFIIADIDPLQANPDLEDGYCRALLCRIRFRKVLPHISYLLHLHLYFTSSCLFIVMCLWLTNKLWILSWILCLTFPYCAITTSLTSSQIPPFEWIPFFLISIPDRCFCWILFRHFACNNNVTFIRYRCPMMGNWIVVKIQLKTLRRRAW